MKRFNPFIKDNTPALKYKKVPHLEDVPILCLSVDLETLTKRSGTRRPLPGVVLPPVTLPLPEADAEVGSKDFYPFLEPPSSLSSIIFSNYEAPQRLDCSCVKQCKMCHALYISWHISHGGIDLCLNCCVYWLKF